MHLKFCYPRRSQVVPFGNCIIIDLSLKVLIFLFCGSQFGISTLATVRFSLIMTSVLVFGYGNLSRGDDALGPLVLDYIEKNIYFEGLEVITDFQLQIEHALDLVNRELVLFVDASVSCDRAFSFTRLVAEKDKSYTTHAMSPSSVLKVYQDIEHHPPPPCFLLSIQALNFELGTDLSSQAQRNLNDAIIFTQDLLVNPKLSYWSKLTHYA